MENKITIILTEDKKIEMSSDTPDFKELAKFICDNPDYDVERIKIECDDTEFDGTSFRNALLETIKEVRKSLQIDKSSFLSQKEAIK